MILEDEQIKWCWCIRCWWLKPWKTALAVAYRALLSLAGFPSQHFDRTDTVELHFHRGVFDLKAVILAQPCLVTSRNSCKMSTCQTSLYVLPEYFVISLMLANVIPGWRQLVVVWDTEDPVTCRCTGKKCCYHSTFAKHLFQHAWKNWFWIGFRVKIRFSLNVYEIQVFPLPDFNRNV